MARAEPPDRAPRPLAVAFVHGMGSVEPDFAEATIAALEDGFADRLSHAELELAEFVAEPVYWADIPRAQEEEVWRRVTGGDDLDQLELRRLIFNMAGDTLAYQPSEGRLELYLDVHRRVADVFATLAERAGEGAPLCIVAHSLGSVVVHNFLYDTQHRPSYAGRLPEPETPLARGATLALLCTYGSPIAIWRLRFGDDYRAIEFPGREVGERFPRLEPKWFNLYDADDVLAYPIGDLTDRYRELRRDGLLVDRRIEIGDLLTGWNPLVHYDYLRDDDALAALADDLVAAWRGAYPAAAD